ncbi:putative uronyl 2-sulfotransferase [Apostichopus japonicus]|uniref:Putative uronyl 2-sulfotransferase n=1 Tax=Stichopus japonicus TaxID=307972 RepID=A0A2G8L7H8_STIJA|nr:putative uronyl 2-sulfotransferase [Apostichopus japonicus]
MKPRQRPPLPTALRDLTVIYYMVPLCGSRTFSYLIGQLKKINPNWQDVLALTSAESDVRVERTKEVPKFVMEAKKPAFLYVDTHFVNFKRPGNIMYISIVRDPMERFLSQFSFHISGDNLTAPQNDRDWVKTKESALDQCIEQERHICSGRWLGRAMHSRFCGTGIVCYQTCRQNFEQGKREYATEVPCGWNAGRI